MPSEEPRYYNREPDESGLSGGAIAGIVIAGIAVAVIVGVLIFLLFGKKKIILDNSNSSYSNISYSQVNYNNKI